MKNYLMSCYFTSKKDPQRNIEVLPDSVELINRWYGSASIVMTDTKLIIFHDGHISESTKALYYDIDFIKVNPSDILSLNDYRFQVYIEYLLLLKGNSRVLITDLFDVEFYENPFTLMTRHPKNTLYIGSNDLWKDKPKQLDRLKGLPVQINYFLDKPLLNPGIIGGRAKVVADFLNDCMPYLGAKYNNNMPMSNIIGYADKWKRRLFTGFPLHTKFKEYEPWESGAYVRHK